MKIKKLGTEKIHMGGQFFSGKTACGAKKGPAIIGFRADDITCKNCRRLKEFKRVEKVAKEIGL